MNTPRRNLDAPIAALMVLLCACWGMQQVAIKLAAPSMGTIFQTGLRSSISALLVVLFMLIRRQPFLSRDRTLWPGIAAGVLFAAEFLCVSVGLNMTSASRLVVFLYTAPIFTVLGLHWLIPSERLHLAQWLGILLAFIGIAVAFSTGYDGAGHHTGTLWGDLLGVAAALLWSATTLLIRNSTLSEAAPAKTLLYQLVVSALLILPLALWSGEVASAHLTALVWQSLFFQAVIVSFASYLAWFWILRCYLASRVAVFSFLTPLFGVGFGMLFLHEVVALRFALGAALVLGGIVMVNRR